MKKRKQSQKQTTTKLRKEAGDSISLVRETISDKKSQMQLKWKQSSSTNQIPVLGKTKLEKQPLLKFTWFEATANYYCHMIEQARD